MGRSVGAEVGSLVGLAVGVRVGDLVGEWVGDADGDFVGDLVGLFSRPGFWTPIAVPGTWPAGRSVGADDGVSVQYTVCKNM